MRPAVPGFLPFLLVFLLPGCAGGPAEITSISPGTPGFVINGYLVSGAQPLAKFKKVVRRALGEAN